MTNAARERPGWSVRTHILVVIVVVTGVALALAGGIAYLTQRAGILADIDERLYARVESARTAVTGATTAEAGATAVPVSPGTASPASTHIAIEWIMQRVVPGPHESALALLDGRPAYLPPVEIAFHLEDDPALMERIAAEVSDDTVRIGTSVSSVLGHVRYIAAPVAVGGDPSTGVYITAVDLPASLAELNSAFRTYAWLALGATALVGVVGWFVAGRLLRPLRALREAASRITVSDISERLPVTGDDDISQLTRTVNGMFDRLEGSLTAQRRLLDDVRHELKTPITIVRGHLELLDPHDTEEVAYTRTLSIGELDRMAGLVDRIELLAEVPEDRPRLEPTDIAALTEAVHRKASVMPGHDWILGESADVVVSVDPRRITQAWLQLADNAAKYSPPGSPIRIGSTRRDDTVECWVADEGAGIPAGSEARIFERFGRVDTGRGIAGSGLGLPIVKAIAETHGGRVSLASSSAGSTFSIVLPLTSGAAPASDTEAP
ncbi:HAMP domain-containing sensor histidine kinase [Salinibacterium sp. ZJ77]|uniref:sensor histidine kinase n=1 Tax=Salinibacterium sp. ZJ77 TaxID=2708337 RepID=UPI001422A5C2|nr:HAMP domain-containing sensor histidine kinase [Salinibacterium sp. ZJ77]